MKLHHLTTLLALSTTLTATAQNPLPESKPKPNPPSVQPPPSTAEGKGPVGAKPADEGYAGSAGKASPPPADAGPAIVPGDGPVDVAGEDGVATQPTQSSQLQKELKRVEEELARKTELHKQGSIGKDQLFPLQRELLRLQEKIAGESSLSMQPGNSNAFGNSVSDVGMMMGNARIPPSNYHYRVEELKLVEEELAAKMAEHEKGLTPQSDLLPLRRERLRLQEQIAAFDQLGAQHPRKRGSRPLGLAESRRLPGLMLEAGTLEAAVKDFEDRTGGGGPPVLFGPGVKDLKIPAPLRLNNVRIVDALALIAAAAGCNLEPIYAPDGGSAIGYRLVQASGPTVGFDPSLTGGPHGHVGVSLGKKDGDTVISQVRPDSPAARGGVQEGDLLLAVGEEHGEEVDVRSASTEEVAKLIRGTPGTVVRLTLRAPNVDESAKRVVSLTRSVPPLPATSVVQVSRVAATPVAAPIFPAAPAGAGSPPVAASPGVPTINAPRTTSDAAVTRSSPAQMAVDLNAFERGGLIRGLPAQVLSTDRIVTIYALGSLLTEQDMQKKQQSLEELISSAFLTAGLHAPQAPGKAVPKEAATLHFHPQSKALIVKATRAEHQLIQQVLDALQENARSASPGFTTETEKGPRTRQATPKF